MDMAKFKERFRLMPEPGKSVVVVQGQQDAGLHAKCVHLESRVRELEEALKVKEAQLQLALQMWQVKDEAKRQTALEKARGGSRLKVFAGQEGGTNAPGRDTGKLGGTGAQAQEHGRTPDESKPGGSPQDGGGQDKAPLQGGVLGQEQAK